MFKTSCAMLLILVFSCGLTVVAQGAPPAATPARDPLGAAPEPAPKPDDAPARADLGEANGLVLQKDYAGAERVLAELEQSFPDDPALLLMRGEVLLALGRAEPAREVLERGAALDADRPRLHFQLGTARAAGGDRQAALEAFAREIEVNDDVEIRVLARLNRSLLLQQERRWADAAQELERILELDPARTQVFGDLAALYLHAGKTDECQAVLERGLAAGFRSAEHFYSLGARLYNQGRYSHAVEELGRALEIDPGFARAERSLAASYEKLDRPEQAAQHFRRYLELEPNAPDADSIRERIQAAQAG